MTSKVEILVRWGLATRRNGALFDDSYHHDGVLLFTHGGQSDFSALIGATHIHERLLSNIIVFTFAH